MGRKGGNVLNISPGGLGRKIRYKTTRAKCFIQMRSLVTVVKRKERDDDPGRK